MPATVGSQPLVAASRTTGVVGMRADRATVAAVHALAKSRGVTKSKLLVDAITMLAASGITAPSRDAVSAMNALIAALKLPPDVDEETLLGAIKELFVAAASPEDATAAAPGGSDLSETADPAPPPTALSAVKLGKSTRTLKTNQYFGRKQ
ncbi:MAG: hypothetical protein ABI335_18305 [Polyangiaceae bacterium]